MEEFFHYAGNELHDSQFVGECEISDDSEIDVLI